MQMRYGCICMYIKQFIILTISTELKHSSCKKSFTDNKDLEVHYFPSSGVLQPCISGGDLYIGKREVREV
jgi:hypothetical protein